MDDATVSEHASNRDERILVERVIAETCGDASIVAAARRAMNCYAEDTGITVAVTIATNVLTISVTPD